MAFTETFSLFLLHDLPWTAADATVRAVFEELWGHLRLGVLYFMRFEPGQHTWARILAAQEELLAYGKRAEEVRRAPAIVSARTRVLRVYFVCPSNSCRTGPMHAILISYCTCAAGVW